LSFLACVFSVTISLDKQQSGGGQTTTIASMGVSSPHAAKKHERRWLRVV
jgi:hypothetical protein